MHKLWVVSGRILFWLMWPLLYVYLRSKPPRTRVVIVAENKVLLVKGWLGSGQWSLPGGGLHSGEDPLQGAIREVREETGILLQPDNLTELGEGTMTHAGLTYRYVGYAVTLPATVPVQKQRYELVDAQWLPVDDIIGSRMLGRDVRRILLSWRERR